jgi:hypothetical protein
MPLLENSDIAASRQSAANHAGNFKCRLSAESRYAEDGCSSGRQPLIIPAGEKLEPTHVGCYGIPNAAGATGRAGSAHEAWRRRKSDAGGWELFS